MTAPVRRKLPIGIQTFAKIREGNYYYVDKTAVALDLARNGGYYFLSRPRRFGKSLFLDTLKELFEGNEPLFRGLYAHDRWDWSVRYPVINISFASGLLQSRAELDEKIQEILDDHQKRLEVIRRHRSISGNFADLIRLAHEKYGQRVVILIDEYDKPILDNLTDRDTALAMREGLRNLYSVIKQFDAHIHFVFLTGVSKFSKVSLFSGLNNLYDLTLVADYSSICGYTEEDVDTVFAPELPGLDRERIRQWYNGYNWLGESVYNPYDVLLLFKNRDFRAYWFETGTPTFLVNFMSERGFFTPDLSQLRTDLELLSAFDVDYIAPEALLFQTGYLTIHQAQQPMFGHWIYTLGYPNHEVESSLNTSLLAAYGGDARRAFENRWRLQELLAADDLPALRDLFHAFYAGIPHDWYRHNPIARYEGYYASIFYSYFAALGLDIVVEDATNHGRVDMAVRFNRHIYLFEFKVVELLPDGTALEQLKARAYAEKYRGQGWPITLIGVEFSRDSRNIVGFEIETG